MLGKSNLSSFLFSLNWTDLALRCILSCYKTEQEDSDKEPLKKKLKSEMGTTKEYSMNLSNETVLMTPNEPSVLGIAIALCCHHRCEWKHYVGKEFFSSQGLTAEDFEIFQRLSSWATCGMKRQPIDNEHWKANLEEHNFEKNSTYEGHVSNSHIFAIHWFCLSFKVIVYLRNLLHVRIAGAHSGIT